MKILVVDDDPLIVELMHASLVSMGFSAPVSASSAKEALEIIEQSDTPFGTLLLDIFLPDMDGVELCAKIRQSPDYSMTPIIMITASRRLDLMERAFRAGATDYVTKPLNGLELGTRVKVAGMLNESLEREKRYRHTLDDLTELTRAKYDEIISLRNVPGIVDHVAMQNTLLRADRGCYALSLFSVKIGGAKTLYENTSAPVFVRMLEQVGAALVETLDQSNTVIAYSGKGAFICLQHGRKAPDLTQIQSTAEAALDASWDPSTLERPTPPRIRFVPISAQRMWTKFSVLQAIEDFTENAEILAGFAEQDEEGLFDRMENRLPENT